MRKSHLMNFTKTFHSFAQPYALDATGAFTDWLTSLSVSELEELQSTVQLALSGEAQQGQQDDVRNLAHLQYIYRHREVLADQNFQGWIDALDMTWNTICKELLRRRGLNPDLMRTILRH